MEKNNKLAKVLIIVSGVIVSLTTAFLVAFKILSKFFKIKIEISAEDDNEECEELECECEECDCEECDCEEEKDEEIEVEVETKKDEDKKEETK